jgi:hypothetical protein
MHQNRAQTTRLSEISPQMTPCRDGANPGAAIAKHTPCTARWVKRCGGVFRRYRGGCRLEIQPTSVSAARVRTRPLLATCLPLNITEGATNSGLKALGRASNLQLRLLLFFRRVHLSTIS